MSVELLVPRPVPVASFDSHFTNVPGFQEARFDAERCAQLFTHPVVGISRKDLPRIHVHVRPDYNLGYTREEREAIRAAEPEEYDTESASCVPLAEDGPYGQKGDVLMTIVYGTYYRPNKLLCHEAVHAAAMLQRRNLLARAGRYFLDMAFPEREDWFDRLEEINADMAMRHRELKVLRQGIITIVRR